MLRTGTNDREQALFFRLDHMVVVGVDIAKGNVPTLLHKAIRPMSMPKSPTRLTMNALLAAVDALFPFDIEADQEVRADTDQFPKTKTIATFPAMTSPSMLKQNSDRYWKNRGKRPGRCKCLPFDRVTS